MKLTYKTTMLACYNGYITQAICINLAPLLYITFQKSFSLSLADIAWLVACNFIVQLSVDFLASMVSDRMNIRFFTVFAHLTCALGLIGLSVFPMWMPPLLGLLIAEGLLGLGGGFTEVMISPLTEACPTEGKSGNMSLLHSFYSWGQAGVVLLSSAFFALFDVDSSWVYLPLVWTVIPLAGALAFCFVPIYRLPAPENPEKNRFVRLFGNPKFLLFFVMMFCAGASEMVMSQWASSFCESALQINKSLGDIFGPCMFALMMGLTRLFYCKNSTKIPLQKMMIFCSVLCIVSYLLAAFSPFPVLSLLGCALCGISVGVFWPGILSCAAEVIPDGGISLFALLALAGDVGCLLAPSIAGKIADMINGDLRAAFVFALLFPIVMLASLMIPTRNKRKDV